MEYNYVILCLADVSILLPAMFDNCIPRQQRGSCSMTRPFLSLGRVWLVRLAADQAFPLSARVVDWETMKAVEIILTVGQHTNGALYNLS